MCNMYMYKALCKRVWKVPKFYCPWNQTSNNHGNRSPLVEYTSITISPSLWPFNKCGTTTDMIGSAWLGTLPKKNLSATASKATSNVSSRIMSQWPRCGCCILNLTVSPCSRYTHNIIAIIHRKSNDTLTFDLEWPERSKLKSLRFWRLRSPKGAELGHILLLNTNRKSPMGSPIILLHLILMDFVQILKVCIL